MISKKISQIITLCKYTVIDNIRQRLFYTLFLFGIIFFGAAGLLSVIGGEQQIRILKNLGIFSSEFIALLSSLFMGTTFLYDEIENKSVYLILSRPVSKYVYLTGRYLGILLSVVLLLISMFLINFLMLLIFRTTPDRTDLVLFIYSILKISVITAVAIFFTVLTTSKMTAIGFTFFFWLLGHFTLELNFLSKLGASVILRVVSFVVATIVPNFYKFSLTGEIVTINQLFVVIIYALLYIVSYMAAAIFLFRNKEF